MSEPLEQDRTFNSWIKGSSIFDIVVKALVAFVAVIVFLGVLAGVFGLFFKTMQRIENLEKQFGEFLENSAIYRGHSSSGRTPALVLGKTIVIDEAKIGNDHGYTDVTSNISAACKKTKCYLTMLPDSLVLSPQPELELAIFWRCQPNEASKIKRAVAVLNTHSKIVKMGEPVGIFLKC